MDHPDPNPPSPEPVPEPDPAPDPEPSDVLSGLSAEKRKALNQFMSNFSEVSFGDFERGGTYDEATLAEFAFMHCKINYTWADRIAVDTLNGERYDTITGKNVDEVLNRYLGVTITHKSYDWYGHTVKYENGKYYQPWAMGDICTTFSVVTEMVRDGDRYRVTFDVYDLDLGICGREDGIGDRYYSMTGAEAKACGDLTYRARGTAVLEDYRYNDYDSYRMISYQDPIHTKQETGTEAPPEAQDDCLSELRDIRGRGMDGHAFRYDANGDGESELFILYTEQDAPQNLWGEICTMQDGTLVRIHGPEKLCVLAGQAGGVIGAVQIDGKNYLEVCSYIHSTEATDGQDTERWCLYDVSKSGFTMTREVDYSRRFGKWDDETTFTYDITDNGKTMTKEQYDAFRSPMIGVHLMASSGTDAHWADDNGGDDNHPVSIRTLDEMCAELERGGLSQIAVPAGEEAEPAAPETFDESNYTIVNSNLSWSEAQAFAARRGGTLAAFETEAEFRFVVDLIEREGYRDVSFLLGGRRDPEGDTYYWVDGNDEFYGGPLHGSGTWYDGCWTAGDPNYEYNGREETVVMMSFESGEDRWTWFDGTADYRNPNRSYGFIIEYDG